MRGSRHLVGQMAGGGEATTGKRGKTWEDWWSSKRGRARCMYSEAPCTWSSSPAPLAWPGAGTSADQGGAEGRDREQSLLLLLLLLLPLLTETRAGSLAGTRAGVHLSLRVPPTPRVAPGG